MMSFWPGTGTIWEHPGGGPFHRDCQPGDPGPSGRAGLIADFDQGLDMIQFRGAGGGSAFGVLAEAGVGEVVNGAAAWDDDDDLIHDADTGTVHLEANGSGDIARRGFAVLPHGAVTLTALDLRIIFGAGDIPFAVAPRQRQWLRWQGDL